MAVFGLGLLVGVAGAASAWLFLNPASLRVAAPVTTVYEKNAKAPVQVVARMSNPLHSCPEQPAAPVAKGKDGKFVMPADLSNNPATDAGAFIVVGKEAAAVGRPRDAEVAFLTACRLADQLKGAGSLESADAKYQLAWHYEWLAHGDGPAVGANRTELVKRADNLYSDSLKVYVANYGQGHEKSRFAADGVAAVRLALGQGQPVAQAAPEPARKPASEANLATVTTTTESAITEPAATPAATPAPRQIATAVVPAPAVRQPVTSERLHPSFDCGKARSVPEKMICSDAQLAQLDRELGRLYARAKRTTSDSASFLRRNREQWRQRELECRDRQCLIEWYAHRRDQLLDEINNARNRTRLTGSR